MLYPSLPPVLKTFASRAGIPDSAVTAAFIMSNGKPLIALQLLDSYRKYHLTAYSQWVESAAAERRARRELDRRAAQRSQPKLDRVHQAEMELLA